MMEITIKQKYKSLENVSKFLLPDFTVLTGKNGSGKSHLLEAMSKLTVVDVKENGIKYNNIKYIPFNGLNPNVQEDCQSLQLTQQKKNFWNNINGSLQQFIINRRNNPNLPIEQILSYIGDPNIKKQFQKMLLRANGNLEQITEEFVDDNYDLSFFNNEIFSSQFATIFKLYHTRLEDNMYNEFCNEKRLDAHYTVLSDDEFRLKYGPKPWILINEMLKNAHLSYQVNDPEGQRRDSDFHICLRDTERNIEIKVNDLSTGEKVLMSLALAIYNTTEKDIKPDVLLLDEPDAALHPEFSKVLIEAVKKSIVEKAGVKVVITTHTPTTVAMADEDNIYRMDKDKGYPVKITKLQAIDMLTRDLDNVRLSIDKRRQVFVESNYDVEYYEKLFKLLNVSCSISPMFLASKSGKNSGSNCTDVINIVTALREKGNDLVYGIIDYDNHNSSTEYIFVLGENKRYAIDNFIFDPLYVAFLLIERKIVSSTGMGIKECNFVQLGNLDDGNLQKLIDYVCKELNFNGDATQYTVQSGKKFSAPNSYFNKQGHELENMILKTWPQLNEIKRGRGDNILKNYMLEHIIDNYRDFISEDIILLFNKMK